MFLKAWFCEIWVRRWIKNNSESELGRVKRRQSVESAWLEQVCGTWLAVEQKTNKQTKFKKKYLYLEYLKWDPNVATFIRRLKKATENTQETRDTKSKLTESLRWVSFPGNSREFWRFGCWDRAALQIKVQPPSSVSVWIQFQTFISKELCEAESVCNSLSKTVLTVRHQFSTLTLLETKRSLGGSVETNSC